MGVDYDEQDTHHGYATSLPLDAYAGRLDATIHERPSSYYSDGSYHDGGADVNPNRGVDSIFTPFKSNEGRNSTPLALVVNTPVLLVPSSPFALSPIYTSLHGAEPSECQIKTCASTTIACFT